MASLRKHPRSPFTSRATPSPTASHPALHRHRRQAQGHGHRHQIRGRRREAAAVASSNHGTQSYRRHLYARQHRSFAELHHPSFFKAWLDRKSLEADSGTHDRYTGIANQFLDHLGRKADSDIKKITRQMLPVSVMPPPSVWPSVRQFDVEDSPLHFHHRPPRRID